MRIECGGMLLGLFLQGILILVSVVLLAFDSMLFFPPLCMPPTMSLKFSMTSYLDSYFIVFFYKQNSEELVENIILLVYEMILDQIDKYMIINLFCEAFLTLFCFKEEH